MNPEQRRAFIEKLLIAIVLVVLALLLWTLRYVVILGFAAVLISILFSVVAEWLHERLRLPRRLALAFAVLAWLGFVAGLFWLFGQRLAAQFGAIAHAIPAALQSLTDRLNALGLGINLHQAANQTAHQFLALPKISGFAISTATILTEIVFVLAASIYFAARPDLYRTGFIKLMPPSRRPLAAQTLDAVASGLKRWLLGQLVAMLVIGLMTGVGLWLIGAPSALAMGVLAGALEFIPYVGPIISAVPPVLLALAQDPKLAIWIIGLYLIVHQTENHILQPLIQQRAVDIPPVLLLLGVIAMGTLFGIMGVIFAAPLAVVLYVLVKKLYVREALETFTPLPGQPE
ncbi:MAG TPA: AI-2E family transporter [Sphingomonas sp.]|nr:AI-2E family transporter [Sphingomonas sp.]